MIIQRSTDIHGNIWFFIEHQPRLRAILHDDGTVTLPDYHRLTRDEFEMMIGLLDEIRAMIQAAKK